MNRFSYLLCLVLLGSLSMMWGQSVSVKKEIAVFRVGASDFSVPPDALGLLDDRVKKVFVNLGRFDVIGVTHRLSAGDVDGFIQKIREYKEQNLSMSEGVSFGKEVFTEADFNRLTGSFIVVIPDLSYYDLSLKDDAKYTVTLKTAVSFVDVSSSKAIGQISLETSGTDANPKEALRMAADSLPTSLDYEVRKMDAFKLKSGILDVAGSTVTIEFGKNMGVQPGDEYVITNPRLMRSGYETVDETGLLVISEVHEEFSLAKVVYSDTKPVIGDQVKELPRLGADISFYADGIGGDKADLLLGLKIVANRGFFSFRPVFGVEVPLMQTAGSDFLLFNTYLGGELFNYYFGRLQFAPTAALGVGSAIPLTDNYSEKYYLSHFGAKAQLSLSYLLTRDIKLFGEAGFGMWFSLNDRWFDSYSGILLGGGITFKN